MISAHELLKHRNAVASEEDTPHQTPALMHGAGGLLTPQISGHGGDHSHVLAGCRTHVQAAHSALAVIALSGGEPGCLLRRPGVPPGRATSSES